MRIGLDTTFLVLDLIREHPGHRAAREEKVRRAGDGDTFVLAPQVLCELVHVVTDARRFEHPLDMPAALARAQMWWDAREVERAHPSANSVEQFWDWMKEHQLGRKRLLDTMLAATYHSCGVRAILTGNVRDYSVFGCFEVISCG